MTSIITEKTVQNIIGRRKREIHKGDCGRILIAAGSPGMAGAAILAARSALRAGSGLVRTAIPAELFPIVQVGAPEATCMRRTLPIQDLVAYDAVCVGPGLGEEEESIDFVKEILQAYEKTLIVDADGLNIIAHQNLFPLLHRRAELYPERTILTPHMGEACRLLAADEPDAFDFSASASASARESIADALVRKTRAVIVLKGAGTIVAAEGMQTYTNTTGNPGMATGGSGDVLSGIITSLAGQRSQFATGLVPEMPIGQANRTEDAVQAPELAHIGAFDAALAGVYIHGLAGDLAACELGEYGVTAGDLALYTAYAIKNILNAK